MHPDIVARASVDSTIAVIPAEAFKRLVRIYPKASAHIVQVILTRFQRVTFLTGHKYLGLNRRNPQNRKIVKHKRDIRVTKYPATRSFREIKRAIFVER